MTGWLILAFIIAVSIAALWILRVRGALLQLTVAALMMGGAGYAVQGRPDLPSSTTDAAGAVSTVSLTEARHAFFGDFTATEHWLIMSESMARRGNTANAVNILRSAVREHPRDPALWIGLGNALVDHAQMITPPAQLAYQRATEIAPGHPAAPFFLGLALARSGDRASALMRWRKLLADAPADAGWRPLVEDAIRAVARPPAR